MASAGSNSQDGQDAPYPLAPSLPLPSEIFHVIEYPGYVRNLDNVFQTLGGKPAIEQSFSRLADTTNALELRYRPSDPFCHPIHGEIVATSNVLLKVTRRRKKKTLPERNGDPMDVDEAENPWIVHVDVAGLVTKTCRFRALADYQYRPCSDDSMVKLRKSMMTLDRRFRQNVSVVKVLVRGKEGEPPVMKLINRYKKTRNAYTSWDFRSDAAPSTAPEGAKRGLTDVPEEAIEAMRKLFEKQAIWTRLALTNNYSAKHTRYFKRVLFALAYTTYSGPYRDCWIRYGYDPRQDKESRFLQILDVRRHRVTPRYQRAKRVRGVHDWSQVGHGRVAELQKEKDTEAGSQDNGADDDASTDPTSHIFDGKTYKNVGLIQLHDIQDADLQKMINTKKLLRTKYNRRYGWYDHNHYDDMYRVIKKKIRILQGHEPYEDFTWTDPEGDVLVDEDENEDDEAGDDEQTLENEDNILGEVDGGSARRKETEGRIRSKVDELMRNLQSLQKGGAEDNDGQPLDDDDGEFEYFDDEASGEEEEEDD
ncbi:tau 95 subunit of transcription factor TFIIIC [Rhizophlyctis rosea]|uniref:Tau 95 subunit of transcription factor TFIIIC n=1 Tax=Rhizophlyctis rosea TaxID=64517 RepID=A0AAD5SGC8_9FUNG|nr:tau 95 subunit of transcription factor TFIIIC [Rhizophlyctis rosea]